MHGDYRDFRETGSWIDIESVMSLWCSLNFGGFFGVFRSKRSLFIGDINVVFIVDFKS